MKFENPYDKQKLTPGEQICRTTIEVFRSRHAHIMGTYGKAGALQTTINILIEKLYAELIKSNIGPSYDDERYADAVAGIVLTLGVQRSPAYVPAFGQQYPVAMQTPDRNDRPGVTGMAQPVANPQQPADLSRTPKSKRNRGSKETSK